MSHENFDFQTSWNLRFPPLEPETSSLFWLDTVGLNSVRREIVSYDTIVFYDKVRGRNKAQR
jgi:hypothetical protein